MSVSSDRQRDLAKAVHGAFGKPRGFRKKGAQLVRERPGESFGAVHFVQLQGSRGNVGTHTEVFVNIAADFVAPAVPGLPEEQTSYVPCAFRRRVGDAFVVDDDVGPAAAAIVAALEAQAVPFFDEHTDPFALLGGIEGRLAEAGVGLEGLGSAAAHRRFAALYAGLGQLDHARSVLRGTLQFFAAERPNADPELVQAFAAELGLGRIEP